MRLIVYYKPDSHVNIAADRMAEDDGIVRAYRGEQLVGVFDLGVIDMIYLSGGNDNG